MTNIRFSALSPGDQLLKSRGFPPVPPCQKIIYIDTRPAFSGTDTMTAEGGQCPPLLQRPDEVIRDLIANPPPSPHTSLFFDPSGLQLSRGEGGSIGRPEDSGIRNPFADAEVARKVWQVNPTAENFGIFATALKRLPPGNTDTIKEIVNGIELGSGRNQLDAAYCALMKILSEKMTMGGLDDKIVQKLFNTYNELVSGDGKGTRKILFSTTEIFIRVMFLGVEASRLVQGARQLVQEQICLFGKKAETIFETAIKTLEERIDVEKEPDQVRLALEEALNNLRSLRMQV